MHKCAILKDLNDAQRKVVLHGEGPALVAAGPGSGKTTCLTRRVLYLIDKCNIPPQRILVLTFTKEAAKNMEERFRKQCKLFLPELSSIPGKVHFGTFHSFSYQVINHLSKYSDYQLITTLEKQKIVKNILEKYSEDDVSGGEINRFTQSVALYKNTGRYPENYNMENHSFQNMFEEYEKSIHLHKKIDFDDMLYLCKKELQESPKLLQEWQNKYDYLLIDEFQDMNHIQYSLMQMLCEKHRNIMVVGDDDQAIYGFRGSYPDIFKEYQNHYEDARLFYLTTNYRCAKEIVEASKRLIDYNKNRFYKELQPKYDSQKQGNISVHESCNVKESMIAVINLIKMQDVERIHQSAVLFRTNVELQIFMFQLEKHNIPYVSTGRPKNIYEHFIIKDIMDYFAVANGCKERSLYICLLQKLKIPLGREALVAGNVDLRSIQNFYKSGVYKDEAVYRELLKLEKDLNQIKRFRFSVGIRYILYAMGYYDYLKRKAKGNLEILEEWDAVLEWFLLECEEFADYYSFREYIDLKATNINEQHMLQKSDKGIHLLTLHSAKGREYDEVHIMSINEGNIPQIHRGSHKDIKKIEEERRLFYVGITRAKNSIHLHYLTGSEQRPKYKSRFLEELGVSQKTTDKHQNIN